MLKNGSRTTGGINRVDKNSDIMTLVTIIILLYLYRGMLRILA